MAMEGMDVGAAQAALNQINGTLGEFDGLLNKIRSMIEGIPWQGNDKNQFEQYWAQEQQSAHMAINNMLTNVTQRLNQEIQQQDTASSS